MLKKLTIASLLVILSSPLFAQLRDAKVDDISWLSGCWELYDKDQSTLLSEQWMRPSGGIMLGIGRTVTKGRAVDFEFMRIESTGDNIFFVAKPKTNQEETSFRLIRLVTFRAVFENTEHDFPQRVIYRRQGGKLTGRIEGNKNGKLVVIDFPMTRAKCG
jgi:hypothetical protein